MSPKIAGQGGDAHGPTSARRVRKGEVLFTLESKDFEAQYRQAQAALESARANLTRTSDSSLSSQVIQAQAAVKQAQVQYDDAKDLYDGRRSSSTTAPPRGSSWTPRRRASTARSIALDTAKQNLALIQDKGGPQSTGLASTQVDQAQASLDLAESQLSNTVITSPITGVVSARNVDPGELVLQRRSRLRGHRREQRHRGGERARSMVEKIRLGQTVTVSVDARRARRGRHGAVDTISPAADPRTQGYTVKIAIGQPGGALRPGMFARVSFPVEERRTSSWFPTAPWSRRPAWTTSTRGGRGRQEEVRGRPGSRNDAVTEITSGLDEGALVVTEGQSFLNDGEKVRPRCNSQTPSGRMPA